jgi:FkbM family methyltransferase
MGKRFIVRKAEFILREDKYDCIVMNEVLELDCYRFMDRINIEGLNVLDIGANIGIFSVMAALKGCNVTSYEPEPHNFEMLNKNIEHNSVKVKAYQLAVGKPGKYCIEDNGGCSRLGSSGSPVECVSINTIINEPVYFLKMDCEGSEYPIFEDATDETLTKINEFAIEFHPDLVDDYTHNKVISRLEEFFDLEITGEIKNKAGGIIFGKGKL